VRSVGKFLRMFALPSDSADFDTGLFCLRCQGHSDSLGHDPQAPATGTALGRFRFFLTASHRLQVHG
jgi:hypothetical protein